MEDLQAKYDLATTRLAKVVDSANVLKDHGIISGDTAEHFIQIAVSESGDDPHPESGLPCWCGETHRRADDAIL
jgi:hypothetical protein